MNFKTKEMDQNGFSSIVQENQCVANKPATKAVNSKAISFLEDNRPSSIVQRKLKTITNNNTTAKPLAQLQTIQNSNSTQEQPIQKKTSPEPDRFENNTGLPDNLKTGIEGLSGYSMDDVKVHYNSDKPAQLQAHAYAQGTEIHLGPGQEKHLPHEAWHVVQQKQGRVKPTMQMKEKVNINDDVGLEKEADVMGEEAFQYMDNNRTEEIAQRKFQKVTNNSSQVQQMAQLRRYNNLRPPAKIEFNGMQVLMEKKSPPSLESVIQRAVVNVKWFKDRILQVRYEPTPKIPKYENKIFIVYLPSGFPPSLKQTLIGLIPGNPTEDQLYFTNEPHDFLTIVNDQSEEPKKMQASEDHKIIQAKKMVADYLTSLVGKTLPPNIVEQLIDSIKKQNVQILLDSWVGYVSQKDPNNKRAEATEGLTSGKDFGERSVGINASNYTLNVIVHELFHTLESNDIQGLWNGLSSSFVEAMTEYFALNATGLDERINKAGSPIYSSETNILRMALQERRITFEDLLSGYFLGIKSSKIKSLNAWFTNMETYEIQNTTLRIKGEPEIDTTRESIKYWWNTFKVSRDKLDRMLSETGTTLPEGVNEADVKDTMQQTVDLFKSFPDQIREKERPSLISLLDRYVMQIQKRRPSQTALLSEFGVDK